MNLSMKASQGVTGTTLKFFAIIAMTLDHIGAGLIEAGILHIYDPEMLVQILATETGHKWYILDCVLRMIGRLAFPLFCFLLVEGFVHTKNMKKYVGSMAVFALLSEISFDLAILNTPFDLRMQNVFFTLTIGLLVLMGLKKYEFRGGMQTGIIALGSIATVVLNTDYNVIGILIIVCFYMLRDNKKYKYISVGVISFLESIFYFGTAALALIPIHLYNGERGKTGFKYTFYLYYPAHLLLIFLIRYFLIGTPLIR